MRLIDFGLAIALTSDRPQDNTIAGTPYYMAPEVLEDCPYGVTADIWALGVLLYTMVSGYLPF